MRELVRSFLVVSCLSLTPAFAEPGNPEAGEDVFKKCRACHEVGPDAKNKVGPSLTGIVGRKVGTAPEFAYSDANKAFGDKGAIWTEDELFQIFGKSVSVYAENKDGVCRPDRRARSPGCHSLLKTVQVKLKHLNFGSCRKTAALCVMLVLRHISAA